MFFCKSQVAKWRWSLIVNKLTYVIIPTVFLPQNLFSMVRASNGHNLHPSAPLVRSSLRLLAASQLLLAGEKTASRGKDNVMPILHSLSTASHYLCFCNVSFFITYARVYQCNNVNIIILSSYIWRSSDLPPHRLPWPWSRDKHDFLAPIIRVRLLVLRVSKTCHVSRHVSDQHIKTSILCIPLYIIFLISGTLVVDESANVDSVDEDRPPPYCLERQPKAAAVMEMEPRTYRAGIQQDGFLYILGSTISAFLKRVDGCSSCKVRLCQEIPITSFVQERKYTETSQLCFPSSSLISFITTVDGVVKRSLSSHLHRQGLVQKLCTIITAQARTPSSIRCSRHAKIFTKLFLRKWIRTTIKIRLKDKCEKLKTLKVERRKRKKLRACAVASKRRRLA